MSKIGSRLIRSAGQALAIARDEADPATYKVFVPHEVDVAAIRRKLGLTQTAFASQFELPITTLRDWEQKRARPDTPTRTLLKVIDRRRTWCARCCWKT